MPPDGAAPDDTRRTLARLAPRLAPQWQPGCLVGVVARVIDATEHHEPDGSRTQLPAHFIGAAWPPAADGVPDRWPDAVVIASPTSERALVELLLQLPADATLHLVRAEAVDFGLAVEIVRTADRNLQPWQREALGEFLVRWRDAERAAIRQRFSDRDDGFERFVGKVTGQVPPDEPPEADD